MIFDIFISQQEFVAVSTATAVAYNTKCLTTRHPVLNTVIATLMASVSEEIG